MPDAADDAQVFFGAPVHLPWGKRLQLISVGGLIERDGERFLSNDPTVQPEPTSTKDRWSKDKPARTCADVLREGLPFCYIMSQVAEFRLRHSAAVFYEKGANAALISGAAAPLTSSWGRTTEIIYNKIADLWVYVPMAHDWGGKFLLPVLVDEPLEIVRRDIATGWITVEQDYDPVADTGWLIEVGLLANGEALAPPMMIDARPFHFLHFAAPEPEERQLLRLEIEAEADGNRVAVVQAVADFPLPNHSTVSVWDLTPLSAVPAPQAPIAGPSLRIDDNGDNWVSKPFTGTGDMLVVIAPGDLDPEDVESFEFQFNRSLADISDLNLEEVAILKDLGPSAECSDSGASGYPRDIAAEVYLIDADSRLVVTPLVTLPAGHCFRLELNEG